MQALSGWSRPWELCMKGISRWCGLRNHDATQRKAELTLSRSLRKVQEEFARGTMESEELIELGRQAFSEESAVRLDYFDLVYPDTLDPVAHITGPALVAVAA